MHVVLLKPGNIPSENENSLSVNAL